jgi:hypothetical protein
MNLVDNECEKDTKLKNINNQQKLDLAVLLFRTFVSIYKNNLNELPTQIYKPVQMHCQQQ